MPLRCAILFLLLYYIRPQDWIEGLAGFNIMRPMILLWALALFNDRDKRPLREWVRTPHDWLMLAYFGYVLWTAADFQSALTGFLPLVVFYFFTVQSLTSWDRLLGFLKGWNWMLVGVAGIAVASLYGIDLTGAVDMTLQNKDRLSLGTWIHNNPNALGHSVVVIIPLSYLLYFFRGQVTGMFVLFPALSALAVYCALRTESKGAYVVGGLLVVMLFVIGRPLFVKALALAAAASVGFTALSFLPRMEEMGNLRGDEGVQGRLLAWEQAQMVMETKMGGAGWKQFLAMIRWDGALIPKATHSSYVQIGADLGVMGLALFVGLLWSAFRSGVRAFAVTAADADRERCRRVVLLLIVAYALSSWMINREYHTEYFLLIAAAAALHRLALAERAQETEAAAIAEEEADNGLRGGQPEAAPLPAWALAVRQEGGQALPRLALAEMPAAAAVMEAPQVPPYWNRIGFIDVAMCAALTWAVLYIWDYILKNLW